MQGLVVLGSGSIMMNSYQPGELVFVQGQASECVYLIESGEIELLESADSRTVRIAKLVYDLARKNLVSPASFSQIGMKRRTPIQNENRLRIRFNAARLE